MRPSVRFQAILDGILYSNGYIALCAVVMCQTTAWLFQLQLPNGVLWFVFLGTLASYSLHWYLTDVLPEGLGAEQTRIDWNKRNKPFLLVLFVGSALFGLVLLSQLTQFWVDLLPVIVLTFLYTAPKLNVQPFIVLRRIAVLKTAYLSLVWTYVTVALPLLMNSSVPRVSWMLATGWFLNRFLLIYSVAFWFDYRDRQVDYQSRWLTIVSMLTNRQARTFFRVLVTGFGLTIVLLDALGMGFVTLFCVSMPMVVLVLTARYLERPQADYVYYIFLDSLLMLSGILLKLLTVG